MSSFFNKLKPGVVAANAAANASPNKKKDDAVPEMTPLEKMLVNVGPLREDGTDKFFGLENFGNTCYCNSIVQALYHTELFRDNVLRYPPYSPSDTPDGKPRKVNVQIRPPMNGTAAPGTPQGATGPAAAAAAAAGNKKPPPPQPFKQRPPISPGQPPNGQAPVRPEDKPDTPEYKKKQAMIKGPVLELAQENASSYDLDECTFTGIKDIFTAFIESNARTGVLSPLRFLEIFRSQNDSFKNSMHQDAHEFYGLALNDIIRNVEEASTRIHEREDAQNKEGLKQPIEDVLGDGSSIDPLDGPPAPGSGWVHDIFEGVLTSETRCLTCERASKRDETFLDLSIDLEEHSSVTSCLRKFSAEEMLCERNKFHCDHCGGLQEAEKRMKIKRLPKILALHLKRFKYSEDYTKLEKLFHRVVYPYQLRMFNTTEDAEDPDRLYELYAVVVHIGGNAYHGHYVAVIKTKEFGWLLFDDEMVEPVDKQYVRNFFGDKPGTACAYVLFYQETTFEKMQAEQEREGLEEIRLASQSAGLALSPEDRPNGVNSGHLSRQVTQPVAHTIEDHDDLALEHARTAPSAVISPLSRTPPVPPMPTIPAGVAVSPTTAPSDKAAAKAEAARSKEEKEREKKEAKAEAKAAEKARKLQEKETVKEQERLRKERDMARRNEAEEFRKAIAASKQTHAEEMEAQSSSVEGGNGSSLPKTSGFLSRSSRGSKSMSRKSFAFLGKDKEKAEAAVAGESSAVNGSANGAHLTNELTAEKPPPPPQNVSNDKQNDKHALKDRFSFSLGRKKSNTFLP